ncbi:TonB-linked SusC/RagA family outer membrane protein [Dyadobacter jejuensis]|uniref:TonB-linked SusC/RagA family outer membrane protein n=1 Tax=Dyadobacter jejuensis TaxID=1082580 RepID=A0A316AGT7_9BACT|nr:TonB-dependent receptor [Dyadobacter jejuensis]PWJ56851.1 TonB-linked SusC/RagA family outer membrane protein [Dyadobacter jejuensis]
MKKSLKPGRLVLQIMKITVLQLMVAMIFSGVTLAFDGHAQDFLNKSVNLHMERSSLRAVLQKVEKQAGVQFVYSSKAIQADQKVSIHSKEQRLEDFLRETLLPLSISYRVVEGQIVLNKMDDTEQPGKIAPPAVKLQSSFIDLKGKVVDGNGMGLPGVSILVKDSQKGTTTDVNGNFSLSIDNPDAVLVFSFVGYTSQEVLVGSRTQLNITLEEDNKALEEIVVVGYGTQKKVNVIGSISQISSKNIENRPVTQASQAITGQMPGVTVIQRSGRPGASGGEIRVRGVGSFGAQPDALVLIDGIPGSMNDINPNDIQTISVLKDASSAAIYGARSANGVILITTKNGTSDKLSVSYDGYVGVNKATRLPDLVNSWEYAEMFNEASGSNSFSAEDIEKFKSQSDPDNYPNTRFLEDLFSGKGVQNSHTITLSGGNDNNRFFLSGAMLQQQGIVPKNRYSRFNQRLNIQNKIGKNFELNTRLFGAIENRKEPQATANKGGELSDQLIQNAVRYPSIYLGQASNGDFGIGPESGGTPVSWLASDSYYRNPKTRVGINSRLEWKPLEGLTLSAIGGFNFSLLEERSYLASQRLNEDLFLSQSYLNQSSDKEIYKTMQFTGEYSKEFGPHFFSILGGYSFENQEYSYLNVYRQDFPSNQYTVPDMGGLSNQQAGGYDAGWAIQSLFSRLKYSLQEKYLFEFTVRNDGSSRFPAGQKYAFFPSAAVGWRLSQENFVKDIRWISDLKLKASLGILGNQNIGNYPYQQVLTAGRNYPIGNQISTGAAYSIYTDPNIKWETTKTTDIGLESSFFNNQLLFNLTYFKRNTEDILFKPSASVSNVLGVAIAETNTGAMQNSGWEFDLGYRGSLGDFKYNINGNFSIIKNKVVTLGLGNVTQPNGFVGNGSDIFIGYPMQMYYGYLSDGVFLNEQEVSEWPDQKSVTPNAQAGDLRYKDISGPDGVPDGKVDPTYDRTYLGSRIPKYTFGTNLGFSYKNFDFSTFLQGVAGVKGQLSGYAGYAFFNQGNIQRWQMEGRFNPAEPTRNPDYPRLEVISNSGTPNTVQSDFWVINASYLRVKNMQLGYTLPSSVLNALRINRMRVYVSAENLLTVTKYRNGWDPEVNGGGAFYPILRTVTFGVNLKL